MNANQSGDEEISQEAYRLWEQDGRPEGRDQEYWFRAKESLSNKQKPAARTGSARAATDTTSSQGTDGTSPQKRSTNARKATARQAA